MKMKTVQNIFGYTVYGALVIAVALFLLRDVNVSGREDWDSKQTCHHCQQLGTIQREDSLELDRCTFCIGKEWNMTDRAEERRVWLAEQKAMYLAKAEK